MKPLKCIAAASMLLAGLLAAQPAMADEITGVVIDNVIEDEAEGYTDDAAEGFSLDTAVDDTIGFDGEDNAEGYTGDIAEEEVDGFANTLGEDVVSLYQRDSYRGTDRNLNLRFVTRVNDNGSIIKRFGTWIVSEDYFSYISNDLETTAKVKAEGNGDINTVDKDNKKSFTADLMGIPSKYANKKFYAKSFVKFDNGFFEQSEVEYTTPRVREGASQYDLGVPNFETRFVNRDVYLYRVGNSNAVSLGTLFKERNGASIDSSTVDVKIETVDNTAASGTYTKNTSDWTKGTIQFSGTGVVKVTINDKNAAKEENIAEELLLEVVDGTNFAEGATLSGSKNIVLLSDVKLGNSNGQNPALYLNSNKLYGNGFKIDAAGTGISSQAYGIIGLYNSEIDNAIIIGPTYSNYPAKAKNDYYASVICAYDGNSAISNSYISGAAAPVRSRSNISINNCVLSNGYVAGVIILGGNVSTNDVTTIGNNSLGVVVDMDAPDSAKLTINGDLTQHNFVAENATGLSTYAEMLKSKMFESSYAKYQFSSNGTKYVNTGIVSLSSKFGGNNIIDNRTDKKNYSGMTSSMSLLGVSFNGYVYTMENTDPSMLETSYTEPDYEPSLQKPYAPVFSWSIPTGSEIQAGGDSHFYKDSAGVLQIQFLTGKSRELDMSSLTSFVKYGNITINYDNIACVKNSSGSQLPVTDGKVTFTEAGEYTITYSYTDTNVYGYDGELTDPVNYDKTINVNVAVKKQAPNAVITVSQVTGTMIWGTAGSVFDPDYTPAAQIFDDMTITDYDDDGNPYTVLDGNNQTAFLNNIASVVADSDNKTGFTINFPDGCKLVIKCGAPYNSGTLEFKKYNNKFLMCGSKAYNNRAVETWNVNSYTYTGRNGVAVSYETKRGFTSTTDSESYSLSNLSNNKFLMYDAQGGTVSPIYTGTSPATLPTPTREGYTFLNWNTKADGTGTARSAGTSMTFSSATTLYAIWVKNVEVSFSLDGDIVNTISAGAGTTQTLPTRSSIMDWLEGWYTEEDGGTKIGNSGGSFAVPATDTTYYAHWSPKYAVAYNANGGAIGTENAVYEGTALTLPAPTNGSKTFEGWFTAAEGGTKIGADGDSYVPTANIELFAHWSDNILVSFDGNGGTTETKRNTYDHVTPISLPSATWAGHQFNGWYTAASGGTKVGDAGASYAPTANITLYAQWTPYTVTYNANSGSVSPATDEAGTNGTVTLPTPTRTGYTFNGWYTAASGGTKVGNGGASYTPTANIKLYAQWTINSYKVTINTTNSTTDVTVNGTTVNSGDSVAYNSVVKVVLSYSQSNDLTFLVKQGSNDVTLYGDEACTSSKTGTAAGTYYFKMPAGEVTITSSSSGCFAEGTLITLADGTQKPVEEIDFNDNLLTYSFYEGRISSKHVIAVERLKNMPSTEIIISLDNGSSVTAITYQSFFDMDERKYFEINGDNYQEHIGKNIMVLDGQNIGSAKIINITADQKNMNTYELITANDFNFFANNILTCEPFIFCTNIFEIGSDYKVDTDAMARDIQTYGMFEYSEFSDYMSEAEFNAFNGPYFKVAIGKGLIDLDYIFEAINKYWADYTH